MATNEILPFAGDSGANVQTQAEYSADTARPTGYEAGLLPSVKLNKVLRQTSLISAALAKVVVDTIGQDVLDDGDVTGLSAKLALAFQATSVNATAFGTERVTATAGQTVLSLTSHTYVPGANQINIYLNGSWLKSGVDFTETSSTSATLTSPAELNDEYDIVIGNPVGSIVNALGAADGVLMVGNATDKRVLASPAAGEGAELVGLTPEGSTATKTVYVGLNLRKYVDDFDHGNDDDQAVHDALTWSSGKGNAVLNIHAGKKYTGLSQVTLPSGVTLRGSGERLNGLEFNTASGTPSILFGNGYYQRLEDLNITHLSPGSAPTAILWQDNDGVGGSDSAQYPTLKNLRITNHSTGIRGNAESTWARLIDVVVTGCSGTAFSFTNPNFLHFVRCIADTNASGWYLQNCLKAVLDTCTAQVCSSTSVAAIQVVDSDNVDIGHLWTERNGFHCVQISGASRLTRLTECLIQGAGFTGTSAHGLYISGTSSGTIVDGGWFGGNLANDIRTDSGTSNAIFIEPRSTTTLAVSDASASSLWLSRNMRGIKGISATQTSANNLRGSGTISGTDTYVDITFSANEPDTVYYPLPGVQGVTGTPASGSRRVSIVNKTVSGFRMEVETAPGVGNSVSVSWHLIR